jgi:hypothetical protein
MVTNIVELLDGNDFLLEEYINPNLLESINFSKTFAASKTTGYKLCIFYADPVSVNQTFNPTIAGQFFSNYDYIVFGDGVQNPTNTNYQQNIQTVQEILKINPNCLIFGYIDLGVTTNNYSFQTIENKIAQWQTFGAKGIFFDDAGFDFQVSRIRLNTAIDLAHQQNLPVCINAWSADDVFSSAVNETYNPQGLTTSISSMDYYLLESFIYNDNSYKKASGYATDSGFATMSDITYRSSKALNYKSQIGFKLFGSSIYTPSITNSFNQAAIFDTIEAASIIIGLDAYSFDQISYSSNGANATQYVQFSYNRNYNDLKNKYGLDSVNACINTDGLTLKYKESVVYINGTTYYAISDINRVHLLKTTIDLGSTATASLSTTVTSPIFSSSKPVVACAVNDSTNSTPVAISVNPSNGSLNITISAINGTISGNIDINLIC